MDSTSIHSDEHYFLGRRLYGSKINKKRLRRFQEELCDLDTTIHSKDYSGQLVVLGSIMFVLECFERSASFHDVLRNKIEIKSLYDVERLLFSRRLLIEEQEKILEKLPFILRDADIHDALHHEAVAVADIQVLHDNLLLFWKRKAAQLPNDKVEKLKGLLRITSAYLKKERRKSLTEEMIDAAWAATMKQTFYRLWCMVLIRKSETIDPPGLISAEDREQVHCTQKQVWTRNQQPPSQDLGFRPFVMAVCTRIDTLVLHELHRQSHYKKVWPLQTLFDVTRAKPYIAGFQPSFLSTLATHHFTARLWLQSSEKNDSQYLPMWVEVAYYMRGEESYKNKLIKLCVVLAFYKGNIVIGNYSHSYTIHPHFSPEILLSIELRRTDVLQLLSNGISQLLQSLRTSVECGAPISSIAEKQSCAAYSFGQTGISITGCNIRVVVKLTTMGSADFRQHCARSLAKRRRS
ncbi:hypothetical protein BJ508DRAFT_375870 [Ascobolus immersus RN42]|uniref:Uncharacterized protein n=1 Tax=Ascobolus immersus RN42 TaxID=1160509 RepID=A0A3N4ID62_ASCIM|nr:hypothetical protein BJ508DRAFT_375870 [Ascobolus immersus RN42]